LQTQSGVEGDVDAVGLDILEAGSDALEAGIEVKEAGGGPHGGAGVVRPDGSQGRQHYSSILIPTPAWETSLIVARRLIS
jgi:hypothetical protein